MVYNKSKFAVFGGSFNPPHLAHIIIIKNIIKFDKPNRLIVVPSNNPFKEKNKLNLQAVIYKSFCNIAPIVIDWHEYFKAQTTYTLDTILRLKFEYELDDKLDLYIGSDVFNGINKWHEYKKLLKLVNLIVIKRSNEKVKISGIKYQSRNWDIPALSSSNIRSSKINLAEKTMLKLAFKEYKKIVNQLKIS